MVGTCSLEHDTVNLERDGSQIYERGADVGGTWRVSLSANTAGLFSRSFNQDNTYPACILTLTGFLTRPTLIPLLQGCASDVPIHFYTLSTDLTPDWKNSHGTQPEILEYMQQITDKYNLRPYCRFHTSLDKAEWDANANVWRIETRDVRTGKTQVSHATALVSAIGVLVVPSYPKLRGIESFKGETFHSARWRHDVALHGKRVGVLGNGSTASVVLLFYVRKMAECTTSHLRSQLIPKISANPTINVVNFARTKMWYVPGVSPSFQRRSTLNQRNTKAILPYREITKWCFAHIPLAQRIHRFVIAASVRSISILFLLLSV